MFAHIVEPGGGVGVPGPEGQHPVDIALAAGGLAADRIDQLEHEAEVPDEIVDRGFPEVTADGGAVMEALFHRLGHAGGFEGLGGHVVDLLRRGVALDAEDVDLVSVAEDLTVQALFVGQVFRKAVEAVVQDGLFQQAFFPFAEVRRKTGKQAVGEEQCVRQFGVVHRIGVHKGVEAPHLFKAPNIVQHAAEPGEVLIGPDRGGDAAAEAGDPIGVVDLEADLRVGGVIGGDIVPEGVDHAGFVNVGHNIS